MKHSILNALTNYTNWIISNYQTISKINSSTPILRLISIENEHTLNETFFIIQISGKNLFPKLTINDFIKDPSLIKNFNVRDQEKIQRFLPNYSFPVSYRITERTFDIELKQFIFTIEYHDQGRKIKKKYATDALNSLFKNIKHFDAEDAFLLGAASRIEIF